jgi:rhodanese-related sulfurtransferase
MKNILLVLLSALYIHVCGSTGKQNMQQQELLRLIELKQAPAIIDVRSESEFLSSHVPGAIHVPFWAAFSPSELENRKPSDLLVLYCQHGPRAGIAKLALSLSGFENIIYLEGHMSSWLSAELPIEKNK